MTCKGYALSAYPPPAVAQWTEQRASTSRDARSNRASRTHPSKEPDMTDYRITIRCDHTTAEGARRQPPIAVATYIADADEWVYTSRKKRAPATSIRQWREQYRSASQSAQREMSSVEVQYPQTETHNGEELRSDPSPNSERIVIRCAYGPCGQSVQRLKANLDRLMEKARHAGLAVVPLSYLRANL